MICNYLLVLLVLLLSRHPHPHMCHSMHIEGEGEGKGKSSLHISHISDKSGGVLFDTSHRNSRAFSTVSNTALTGCSSSSGSSSTTTTSAGATCSPSAVIPDPKACSIGFTCRGYVGGTRFGTCFDNNSTPLSGDSTTSSSSSRRRRCAAAGSVYSWGDGRHGAAAVGSAGGLRVGVREGVSG